MTDEPFEPLPTMEIIEPDILERWERVSSEQPINLVTKSDLNWLYLAVRGLANGLIETHLTMIQQAAGNSVV